MKKNADNIGNRSGTTQRVMRARKIPLAAWISAGVAVIMIGVLAILAIVRLLVIVRLLAIVCKCKCLQAEECVRRLMLCAR